MFQATKLQHTHIYHFLMVICIGFLGCSSEDKADSQEDIPTYTSYYDTIPFEAGKALASQHCKGCHQLPDPSDLPKANWERVVLPSKAQLYGVKMASNPFYFPQGPPNFQITNDLPPITQSEWEELVSYFIHEAPVETQSFTEREEPTYDLSQFKVRRLAGQRFRPYASLLQIDEERQRIYLGDSEQKHIQVWTSQLTLEETLKVYGSPAHFQWNDNKEHLVLLKSTILPSDYLQGQLIQLSAEERSPLMDDRLLEKLPYATDLTYVDLNQDKRDDILLSGQGHYKGQLVWYEQMEDQTYTERVLINIPGALKSEVQDFDSNGLLDVMTLFGRPQEKVMIFYNKGEGKFEADTVLEFPLTFGSTDFQALDVNGDGFQDIVHTSGANDYPVFYKDFHGLRVYLNNGQQSYEEAFHYPLNGANQVAAEDYDEDGDIDLAITSFFPDYGSSPYEAFVYLENEGGMNFSGMSFEKHPLGKWGMMKAGDIDGDGDTDIVLANSMLDAEKDSRAHQKLWMKGTPALVVLENLEK